MTEELWALLKEYVRSAERGGYLQRMEGVVELERRGYVDWCGESFGTSFYCATEAGIAALKDRG